jgi:hypothetical protein
MFVSCCTYGTHTHTCSDACGRTPTHTHTLVLATNYVRTARIPWHIEFLLKLYVFFFLTMEPCYDKLEEADVQLALL